MSSGEITVLQSTSGIPDWPERIRQLCLQTPTRNPWALVLEVMDWDSFPPAGQVYHGLIAGALMAAYQNATEKYDKNAIATAIKRAESLPAGFCAGFGADAGAIAAGIVISVIHGNTVRSEHSASRSLAHQMTANCLLAIANNVGNRCCKRTAFQVLETATNFLHANMHVVLDKPPSPHIVCNSSANNKLCNRDNCRYHAVSLDA